MAQPHYMSSMALTLLSVSSLNIWDLSRFQLWIFYELNDSQGFTNLTCETYSGEFYFLLLLISRLYLNPFGKGKECVSSFYTNPPSFITKDVFTLPEAFTFRHVFFWIFLKIINHSFLRINTNINIEQTSGSRDGDQQLVLKCVKTNLKLFLGYDSKFKPFYFKC